MTTRIRQRAIPPARDAANRPTIDALSVAVNEMSGAVGTVAARAVRVGELLDAGILQLTEDGLLAAAGRLTEEGFSGEFADLLNKPTTLAGYGITDAVPKLSAYAYPDANSFITFGSTLFTNTAANTPTGDWATVLSVGDFARTFQIGQAWNTAPENAFFIRRNNGGWSPWYKLWHSGNFDPTTKVDKTGGTVSGDMAVSGNLTVGTTASSTSTFMVLQPGSSPAGSFVSINSPSGVPGLIAQYGTTKRRDIRFLPTSIFIGASASTAAPANGISIGEDGGLTATGDVSANGAAYYGDAKEIVRFSDTWLRLNPANQFTSGIYFGTGLARSDGAVQVGSSSTAGFYASTTVPPQWKGVELGYRKVPLTTKNATYTLVADDAGKGLLHNNASNYTYTIPAVFATGDVITIVSSSTGILTLVGSGVSLFLAPGTSAAGNRTLGTRAVATVFFISSDQALVYGIGVT